MTGHIRRKKVKKVKKEKKPEIPPNPEIEQRMKVVVTRALLSTEARRLLEKSERAPVPSEQPTEETPKQDD